VKSYFQCAKNVLTVGNIDTAFNISASSSRGPVNDGRIKPEITAVGQSVLSTFPNNAYANFSGTSMACPTTVGSLALLEERYRQLHSGQSAPGPLLKAIVCNSAVDIGNSGPDFKFGFGVLNDRKSRRSHRECSTWFQSSVAGGDSVIHTISVPSGASLLKVMLYWRDPAADMAASNTLINDLDLTVIDPTATSFQPWVLNPSSSVNNTAVRGRNSEQHRAGNDYQPYLRYVFLCSER
jgi:hypothetical protein